jgi:uncharacterized protein YigA (DUF484 family)
MAFLLTTRSSPRQIDAITEQAKALEKQAQEIQDQLSYLNTNMKDFRNLTENLYNVHSVRQFRNDMRHLYINKARNHDVIRNYQASEQAYKNAKNEFTDFILTLC